MNYPECYSSPFALLKRAGKIAVAVFIGLTSAMLSAQDLSHRQADLTVTVRDGSGAIIPNADVRIEQVNSEFRWGTAVSASALNDYRVLRNLHQYFNSITFENEMKWDAYERNAASGNAAQKERIERVQSIPAFGSSGQFRVRGHAVLWGSQMPQRIRNWDANDVDGLREAIDQHIEDYLSDFEPFGIDNHDFYNEPGNQRDLIRKILPNASFNWSATANVASQAEIDEIVSWFQRGKEVDPDAKFFINEYNIMNDWTGNHDRVRAYKAFIDALRDNGAVIDGIGVQSHMDRFIPYERLLERFDILSEPTPGGLPGLPIEVTELDINPNVMSLEREGEQVEAMLRAAFEHPAVQGVTMWVMNTSSHWRGNAVMYDRDWQLKPGGHVWIDLVRGEYWTSESGATNASGQIGATVFRGTHRVSVSHNGIVRSMEVDVNGDTQFDFELVESGPVVTYADWVESRGRASVEEISRHVDGNGNGMTNLMEFIFALGEDVLSPTDMVFPEYTAAPDTVTFRFPLRKTAASEVEVRVFNNRADHPFVPALQSWNNVVAEPVLVEEGEVVNVYEVTVSRNAAQNTFFYLGFDYTGE